MADLADQAAGLVEEHLARSLAARRNLARADSGTACLACEAEIPPERRAAMPACPLCVGCQARMERDAWR